MRQVFSIVLVMILCIYLFFDGLIAVAQDAPPNEAGGFQNSNNFPPGQTAPNNNFPISTGERDIVDSGDSIFFSEPGDETGDARIPGISDGRTPPGEISDGSTPPFGGISGANTGGATGGGAPSLSAPRHPYDDTISVLWEEWDLKANPAIFDLWRFARMSTFLPFILISFFSAATFVIAINYLAKGIFGMSITSHGGQEFRPRSMFSEGVSPPDWWMVLSKSYARIVKDHAGLSNRTSLMFGLAVASVSVSLAVSLLLFDSIMRGTGSNPYSLFGFISPIILFQAIAFFCIRTSIKIQASVDSARSELSALQSLMAKLAAAIDGNEAAQRAFREEDEKEKSPSNSVEKNSEKNSEGGIDSRVVAAAVNAALRGNT